MKRSIISMMSVVVALSLADLAQGDQGYQSDFTGTTLSSAGLAKSAGAAGGSWEVNGTKLVGVGTGNARSSVYTTNSWQNDGGFILKVTFWGSVALTRHSFGIVDVNWAIPAAQDWLNESLANAYGIGFSTAGSGPGTDYLGFNNGSSVSVLSTNQGDKTSAATETMSITVTSNSWSYSLNGQTATTGTFSTPFDTSRSYRFIAYAQANGMANFANITLTPILPLGLWTGITGATWDASTTTNFANNALNDPLNKTTFDVAKAADDSVTFADHYWDNSTNIVVTQNLVTIAAGGVSVGNVNFQNNSVDYTISGADTNGITGTTALTINGSGAVTLSSANTYSGGTTLNRGTLIVGANNAVGSGTLTLAGGTLRTGSAGATLTVPIVVSGTASAFAGAAGLNLSGAISGAGTLNVGGSGSGQGTGSRVDLALNVLNGFTGTLNLDNTENYIDLRGANTSAKLMTSGSTSGEYIRLWGHCTFSELSGTGGFIAGDIKDLTINQSTDTTYAGRLSSVNATRSLGLIKSGTGTLTLTRNDNDYKRATTVNGGTLLVNGSITASAVTVNTGATVGGTGNIGGAVTVNSAGHIAPGSASIDTITMAAGLTLNDGSILDFEVDAGGSGDKIAITGGTFNGSPDHGVTVNVTMSGVPAVPATYTLMEWISGSGVNIADFNLVYNGGVGAVSRLSIVGDTLVLNLDLAGTLIRVY